MSDDYDKAAFHAQLDAWLTAKGGHEELACAVEEGFPFPDAAALLLRQLRRLSSEQERLNEALLNAGEALESARNRYARLHDLVPVAFFVLDIDGLILDANPNAAELLGTAPDNLIGCCFAAFVEAGHEARWHDLLAELQTGCGKRSRVLDMRRQDGHSFAGRLDCMPAMKDNNAGSRVSILAVLFDLSDLEDGKPEQAAGMARLTDSLHRLSRELHDRTSPNLAALKIKLTTLARLLPNTASQKLETIIDDARALVDETANNLREIRAGLRPPSFDPAGLPAALERRVRRFSQRTGIAASVDCRHLSQRLPTHQESLLFRIAGEALTNCAKHSRARAVVVKLASIGPRGVLTITDDGIGFDPQPANPDRKPGSGLDIMHEWAELAGGAFHIESAPGQGTRIEVRI